MAKKLDIKIGARYGNVTVVQPTEHPYPHLYQKEQWFICQCSCGNEFKANATRLHRDKVKNCPSCSRRAATLRLAATKG